MLLQMDGETYFLKEYVLVDILEKSFMFIALQ